MTITASASGRLSAWSVMTAATTMAIGAVGPEIWVGVPPKNAAKKPSAIAP